MVTTSPRDARARPRAAAALAAMALALVFAHAPAALAADGPVRPQTIYGDDDRIEVFRLTGRRAANADSVVALVVEEKVVGNGDGTVRIVDDTLRVEDEVCPGTARFLSQVTGAYCSGVLVAPDVILTAGHCIDDAEEFAETRFVFDYRMLDKQRLNNAIPRREVYTGRRYLVNEPGEGDDVDYALIQLTRPVVGHTPVSVRPRGRAPDGTPLYVIGHPSGLPAKYDAGGKVDDSDLNFLYANTDTFGGSSGSPAFDANTHEVVGILSFGEDDYEERGDCNVPVVLSDGKAEEGYTRSDRFVPFVPQN